MLEQNKHLLLYCKVCSKVMDNKPNLLKHEQLCGKKAEHKEMLQKKKTCTLEIHANMKCQLHLKNQYDQINSECDNTGFPLGLENLENLEKWEGIFQSGKSQGILNRLEKSGKTTQNTGKLR